MPNWWDFLVSVNGQSFVQMRTKSHGYSLPLVNSDSSILSVFLKSGVIPYKNKFCLNYIKIYVFKLNFIIMYINSDAISAKIFLKDWLLMSSYLCERKDLNLLTVGGTDWTVLPYTTWLLRSSVNSMSLKHRYVLE